ncbi:PREDICTED: chromosome alignment-maintaining phosphoprotein 1 [Nanorana parkeri]|uniref:chromosome alignment-maintaining phosphoprotein 1 n=1 Tax=Nanorana parkeri TaxID=125878 RepID=UPI000854E40B|nr:PREDICTED: chromosome alignment-maintaining phosphoprotein 1 [Nanorana parkeri]XP_018418564.1 PREDICTED: chromosome alignment-maintaining phosphoprotein 1 [Nanorana parkeri]
MEVIQNQLDCTRCSFHGSDYKSMQIHMGTIHPEFCEEIDAGGLGKLVFYQKSARLFHCHRCFFTSKMFANVYYHILNQHAVPGKWSNETKPVVEPKSEPASEVESEKNDSESLESEDDKYVEEQDHRNKINNVVKNEENDTLTSWPETAPRQDNPDNSDSDFKSSSLEKVSEMSAETKDKESSSEPDIPESESSNNSSNITKLSSTKAKVSTEFSDNDAASSLSKDIPEFSDDDDEGPALPGGIPHFSEDEETAPQTKELESSSEDNPLPDQSSQSRGIEDISEDEMPPEEKPVDNMSEEAAPTQSKDPENSSEEENAFAAGKEMDFSEDDEEDAPALSKDIMEFSEEEEEEPAAIPKNAMDFSDEEETANATKNIMEFSEGEETTNVSKHVMEFSEEGTSGLSKDIMEFSEEDDDTPAISKGIMEFSDEDDLYPQSKDMPKCLEGNSTPTQSKDTECIDDAPASVLKGSSPFSEDGEIPDEVTSSDQKDIAATATNISVPTRLPGVVQLYKATPWTKDKLETINTRDISLTVHETIDASDDKDGYVKDEEILKHVKRVKGRFHCLLCDCRPLKRGPILHHLITRHNMPSPFICKTCGKTFVMETHLKNHLASHTKGLYKCHRCSFQTDHPRGFKKHQTHCENRHKEDAIKPVSDINDIREDNNEED